MLCGCVKRVWRGGEGVKLQNLCGNDLCRDLSAFLGVYYTAAVPHIVLMVPRRSNLTFVACIIKRLHISSPVPLMFFYQRFFV